MDLFTLNGQAGGQNDGALYSLIYGEDLALNDCCSPRTARSERASQAARAATPARRVLTHETPPESKNTEKGGFRNAPRMHRLGKMQPSVIYDVFIIYLLIIKRSPSSLLGDFIYSVCKKEKREKKKKKKKGRKKERGEREKKSSPSITRDEQLVLIFICINFHIF